MEADLWGELRHWDRQQLGRWGELQAAECLREAGHVILARNWRCSEGEIDIISADGAMVVFTEVKTRRTGRSERYGGAVMAVNHRKLGRMRRSSAAWLAAQRRRWAHIDLQVITVEVDVPTRVVLTSWPAHG